MAGFAKTILDIARDGKSARPVKSAVSTGKSQPYVRKTAAFPCLAAAGKIIISRFFHVDPAAGRVRARIFIYTVKPTPLPPRGATRHVLTHRISERHLRAAITLLFIIIIFILYCKVNDRPSIFYTPHRPPGSKIRSVPIVLFGSTLGDTGVHISFYTLKYAPRTTRVACPRSGPGARRPYPISRNLWYACGRKTCIYYIKKKKTTKPIGAENVTDPHRVVYCILDAFLAGKHVVDPRGSLSLLLFSHSVYQNNTNNNNITTRQQCPCYNIVSF